MTIHSGDDWYKQVCLESEGNKFCDAVADELEDAETQDEVRVIGDLIHELYAGDVSPRESWRSPLPYSLAFGVQIGLDNSDRQFVAETAMAESCGY